jgi:hypothetical protein
MAAKKQRRVRHLNEVPARVHLEAGGLEIAVKIPWADLERRLGVSLEAAKKKFHKRRRSSRKATAAAG